MGLFNRKSRHRNGALGETGTRESGVRDLEALCRETSLAEVRQRFDRIIVSRHLPIPEVEARNAVYGDVTSAEVIAVAGFFARNSRQQMWHGDSNLSTSQAILVGFLAITAADVLTRLADQPFELCSLAAATAAVAYLHDEEAIASAASEAIQLYNDLQQNGEGIKQIQSLSIGVANFFNTNRDRPMQVAGMLIKEFE